MYASCPRSIETNAVILHCLLFPQGIAVTTYTLHFPKYRYATTYTLHFPKYHFIVTQDSKIKMLLLVVDLL